MKHPSEVPVSELMQKNVACVSPTTTLLELERWLRDHKVTGAPVTDAGKLVGVISRADILKQLEVGEALSGMLFDYYRCLDGVAGAGEVSASREQAINAAQAERLSKVPVEDVMTRDIVAVSEDATLQEAAKHMLEHNIHRVIVANGRSVCGILTSFDVVRWLASAGR